MGSLKARKISLTAGLIDTILTEQGVAPSIMDDHADTRSKPKKICSGLREFVPRLNDYRFSHVREPT